MTRTPVFSDKLWINQLLRLAQLLLIAHSEEDKGKLQNALTCFESESSLITDNPTEPMMRLTAYVKLLLSNPKSGYIENQAEILLKIEQLQNNIPAGLPNEIRQSIAATNQEMDGLSLIGFLFANQVHQIDKIDKLVKTFEFLANCEPKFREKLLKPFDRDDFSVDIFVSGAWLSEFNAGSIRPKDHAEAYEYLEKLANQWSRDDIAISCRKYRVVILDESANSSDQALELVDDGLKIYGADISSLIRAKAKVLFRAKKYEQCLLISEILINNISSVNNIDQTYFLRDAAISAETIGFYVKARHLYQQAAQSAQKTNLPNLLPMTIGLIADAAIAAWHAGLINVFINEFGEVLNMLANLESTISLTAAHCHATSRHALLFIKQDVRGETITLDDGKPPSIYPGIVSNPEPSKDIATFALAPIELSWYMLAALENDFLLDCGVAENLNKHLKNKESHIGKVLLTDSRMRRSLLTCDCNLFIAALDETIQQFALAKENGFDEKSVNIIVDAGVIPVASIQSFETCKDLTELFVLVFNFSCIFYGNIEQIIQLVAKLSLENNFGFRISDDFIECINGRSEATNFKTQAAQLISKYRQSVDTRSVLLPERVFRIALNALLTAKEIGKINLISEQACSWYIEQWKMILKCQRFQLIAPNIYEEDIVPLFELGDSSSLKTLVKLLKETLPTLDFQDKEDIYFAIESLIKPRP